jgi:hypothetical protein
MSETGETLKGSSAFGAESSALWPRNRSGPCLRFAKTRKADDAAYAQPIIRVTETRTESQKGSRQ